MTLAIQTKPQQQIRQEFRQRQRRAILAIFPPLLLTLALTVFKGAGRWPHEKVWVAVIGLAFVVAFVVAWCQMRCPACRIHLASLTGPDPDDRIWMNLVANRPLRELHCRGCGVQLR